MTTYRFCVAPGGSLVCYKVNNGFIKFSGSYAQQLLEHIKDFSFYTFESNIKKTNNSNYTCDITFESNNHQVIFENIKELKKKKSISIENEIKDLVKIVKENNNNQKEEIENKKQSLLLKKLKAFLYAATISTTVAVTSKVNTQTVKAESLVDPTNDINATNTPAVTSEIGAVSNIPTTIVAQAIPTYNGPVLTKSAGIIHNGPSGGDETYYDLNMNRVVKNMRNKGFDEINYPYWVREDGVKMLGNFVMVAANLQVYPRGSIVQTSLGVGLVCDTGEFAKTNKLKLDIATAWTKGR